MVTFSLLPKTAKQGIDIMEYRIHGSQIQQDGTETIENLARAFHQYLDGVLMDNAGEIAPAFIYFADPYRYTMYTTFPEVAPARAKRILQSVRNDWMAWTDRPFYYFCPNGDNDYLAYHVTMNTVKARDLDCDFTVLCRLIGEPWLAIANITPEKLAANG